MKKFEEVKFNIPALKGVSAKTIEEHLKLYAGYVKNANGILDLLAKYRAEDASGNSYVIGELRRRFSFEYNGIRNHELYFASLQGGARPLSSGSALKKASEAMAGSFDSFLAEFKNVAATTRGIGWAALWFDKQTDSLISSWIDEQHYGQLNGAAPILMLDMWEHSYVADYQPSGKKQYVEDYFVNLNWNVIEKNFSQAAK